MSLPDLPANESLVRFGMPWHGLFIQPIEGAPYIELASGRRIYSQGLRTDRVMTPSTFLLDVGMPAPDLQSEDEDAVFWNKAILSRHGFTPTDFSAWCMTSSNLRVVRTAEGLRYLRIESFLPPIGSIPARVTAFLYRNPANGTDYDQVINTGVADPSKTLSGDHRTIEVMDVTPNGRKWLISLSRNISLNNYPYRYFIKGQGDDYGLGAIVEIEFSADFKSASSTVVADFNDCIAGRDYTFTDGVDFTPGSMSVGDPPRSIEFVTGTSVATSSKIYVVGGWYSPAGELQLLRLKMTRTISLSISAPTSRSDMEQYWSGRQHRSEAQAEYKVGAGAFAAVMTVAAVEQRTPMNTTNTISMLGKAFTNQRPNAPVESSDPIFGEISTGTTGVKHENPAVAGAEGYAGAGWEASVSYQCDWQESNKVISCIARYIGESEFEYLTSRAATPVGVSGNDASTGNIVPGHDRYASNFDVSKWDNVATFATGSYNPVTHQIERQRFGGAAFTWV
ncbi:hypothetical protein [Phytopseudomonas punonensis]|uniref:Uncharacterized protein n=1 Tax=Phytopseudomonas punonensis TaxID=1220495 RepID=A0A1M7LED5_9GAMM|nr:hypothetical protein [Pseudomonas punonensis]SHM76490.1 hypothetical protein SAMN05216288_4239 [Pseudomonas punonensis]